MRLMLSSLGEDKPRDPIAVRVAFFNIYSYNGVVGNAQQIAIDKHILRIEADILGLSEVNSDIANDFINGRAATLGYNYVTRPVEGTFGGQVVLSKYPILSSIKFTSAIANTNSGDPTGSEMFQTSTGVSINTIDLGGVEFVFYNSHLATDAADPTREFMRYIELYRVMQDAQIKRAVNTNMRYYIGGDFNDWYYRGGQTQSFNSIPAGMPGSYSLGNDIAFPFTYKDFPLGLPEANGATVQLSLNLDGDNTTTWGDGDPNPSVLNPFKLDYIINDNRVNVEGSEIVDSEATQTGGLTKYGAPLAFTDSRAASDHKMVFADFLV